MASTGSSDALTDHLQAHLGRPVQLVPGEHQARLRCADRPHDLRGHAGPVRGRAEAAASLHALLTEEVWPIRERKEGEDLIVASWPEKGSATPSWEAEVKHAFDLVTAVRNVRNERGPESPKEALALQVKAALPLRDAVAGLVRKLANVEAIAVQDALGEGLVTFLVGTAEYGVDLGGNIDAEAERKKAEEELGYLRGFLQSVEKKLGNERFVGGAPPQVVENERKKKEDAEAKISRAGGPDRAAGGVVFSRQSSVFSRSSPSRQSAVGSR